MSRHDPAPATESPRRSTAGTDTRSFGDADRGVSEVLGALLLFGIVLLLLAMVQATAVPAANQQVEYDHSHRVAQDMMALDEAVYRTAASGVGERVTLELGATYPPRFFLYNPPPAVGSVSSSPPASVVLDDAVATGETGDYWNGEARTFTTRPLVYRADYNQYASAPTIHYEGPVLYNENPEGSDTVVSEGLVVSGDRITLVTLAGNISTAGVDPESLETVPLSAPAERTTVTNEPGEQLTLRIQTTLAEDRWRAILADELTSRGGHVTSVDYLAGDPYNTVVVTFEQGVEYDLRMAHIGVGNAGQSEPGAHYLTTDEPQVTGTPGSAVTVSAAVLDRYNNAEPGTEVTFSASDGAFGNGASSVTVTADDAGEVTARYTLPVGATEETVTVAADLDGSGTVEARERVTITVASGAGAGGPGGSTVENAYLNNGYNTNVTLAGVDVAGQGQGNTRIDVTLQNTGSETRTVERVRLALYYSSNGKPVASADLKPPSGSAVTMLTGGEFVGLTANQQFSVAPNGTVTFAIRDVVNVDGGGVSPDERDLVFVSVVFENGNVATYHFQVPTN